MGCDKNISEISIRLVKPTSSLVGFASLVYDKAIFLGNIAIHKRPEDGYRLTYPSQTSLGDRKFQSFYPINKHVGEFFTHAVVAELERLTEKLNSTEGVLNYANTLGYNNGCGEDSHP